MTPWRDRSRKTDAIKLKIAVLESDIKFNGEKGVFFFEKSWVVDSRR